MPKPSIKVLAVPLPINPANRVDKNSARMEQEEERGRLTREALAEVDAGNVIEHQSVVDWAANLKTTTPLAPAGE